LQIPTSITKEDFRQLGAALSKIDSANDLWSCDFALHAQQTWEEEGLDLAASATGLSKFFLKRCARIASVFPPTRRHPQLNRNHYRILLPFDQAQIDAWLPTVADQKRLSAKSLRALAVEKFGEPVTVKQPTKHAVKIRETLWTRLTQHAPSQKASALIELILEEWLKRPLSEQAIVLAAAELRRAQKRQNKKPSTPDSRERAAERMRQHRAAQKAARDAEKDAVGTSRNDGNDIPSDSAHPEPSQLSKRQKEGRKRKERELQLQWLPCSRPFPKEHNAVFISAKSQRADCFPTLEAAQAAEQKHFEKVGYHEEVVHCLVPCGAYHVRHVYSK
jgi:hypothetical protein